MDQILNHTVFSRNWGTQDFQATIGSSHTTWPVLVVFPFRRCTSIPCFVHHQRCTICTPRYDTGPPMSTSTPVGGVVTSHRTWMAPFVSAAQKVHFQKPKRDVELDGLFPRHLEYLSDFFCCPVDVHWHWWTLMNFMNRYVFRIHFRDPSHCESPEASKGQVKDKQKRLKASELLAQARWVPCFAPIDLRMSSGR